MRSFIINFPHFHKDLDQEVIVEVEAMLYRSVPNADSDWDSQDFIDIIETTVYAEGGKEVLSVDIPVKVIYSEISAQIRSAEMTRAFEEEEGGF